MYDTFKRYTLNRQILKELIAPLNKYKQENLYKDRRIRMIQLEMMTLMRINTKVNITKKNTIILRSGLKKDNTKVINNV